MRYRILISDDEVDIVEMLTGFFRSKGYEVFSAYNGVETLKLAELQPDIILLDINMPKLDGMEVCKKIRDYVSCPILFLTARIEENDKVQGFSVGGDDYIVKPFSLVELEARVQAHLRREERHQTNTKVKFSGELLIDYSERTVYIQNLTLLSYYLKTQDKSLIKREFMKEFGDMTVREIVVLLPSIFAEYEQKLQHTQINLILKQFGGVDISG